jgi:ATP phosphoribosyltransferase
MTDAPLVLAVPSKGRLQENATAFFGRAGLKFVTSRGERDYRGTIAGVEGAEVAFLSASEIVSQLASGAVHLGITGEDLVREQVTDADAAVEMLTPLGFGHANVVVAVPQAWIDVRSMADLDDVASTMRIRQGRKLRVATKYVNLTRRFFAQHGLADYRIVESLGATEGAPAAGTAEIVVDITTTGSTLSANALKVLDDGVMLASEANLVASVRAPWSERARAAANTILSRIAAEEEARTIREIRTPAVDAALLAARSGAIRRKAALRIGDARRCADPALPGEDGLRAGRASRAGRCRRHHRQRAGLCLPQGQSTERAAAGANLIRGSAKRKRLHPKAQPLVLRCRSGGERRHNTLSRWRGRSVTIEMPIWMHDREYSLRGVLVVESLGFEPFGLERPPPRKILNLDLKQRFRIDPGTIRDYALSPG